VQVEVMTPAQLEAFQIASLKFAKELRAWLKAGGDARLLEFTPLDAWTSLMRATQPLMDVCADCGCKHSN
jgi:hypothetical protein